MSSNSVRLLPLALLALQRATHAALNVLAIELVDLNLTASEINALANLSDGRERTVSELGSAIGTRPTTLTGVLDRLERRGYITRNASATDRRAVVIKLTDTGTGIAETVRRAFADLEHRALSPLPRHAIDQFHRVLAAITEVARDDRYGSRRGTVPRPDERGDGTSRAVRAP